MILIIKEYICRWAARQYGIDGMDQEFLFAKQGNNTGIFAIQVTIQVTNLLENNHFPIDGIRNIIKLK